MLLCTLVIRLAILFLGSAHNLGPMVQANTQCLKFPDRSDSCYELVDYCNIEGALGELVTSTCHTTCDICAINENTLLSLVHNETVEFKLGVITPCGSFQPDSGIRYWVREFGGNISVGNGTVSVSYINFPVCHVPENVTCLAFQEAAINLVREYKIHAAMVPSRCARDVASVYAQAQINHFIFPAEESQDFPWGWSAYRWHPFFNSVSPVTEVLSSAMLRKTGIVYAVDPEGGSSVGLQRMLNAIKYRSGEHLELVYSAGYNETGTNFSLSETPGEFIDPYNSSVFDSILYEMQAAGVEAALFYSAGERVSIMSRIHALRLDFKAIFFDGEDGVIVEYLGDKADMILTEAQWAPNMAHRCQVFGSNAEFVSGFLSSSYGRLPSEQEAMGATVGVLLTLAMQMFGSVASDSVMMALQVLHADTLFGHVYFDLNKEVGREPLTLQYLDGVSEIVGLGEESTAVAVLPTVSWDCRELYSTFVCSKDNLSRLDVCLKEYRSLTISSMAADCVVLEAPALPPFDNSGTRNNGNNILAIVLGSLAGVALLAIGLTVALFLWKYSKGSWIDARLVEVLVDGEGEPVILGTGTFGSVHAATFHGAKVACKCVIPESRSGREARPSTGHPTPLREATSPTGRLRSAPTQAPSHRTPTGAKLSSSCGNGIANLGINYEIPPYSETPPPPERSARESLSNGLMSISSWGVSYVIGQSVMLQFNKEVRFLRKLRHPQITYVVGAYKNEDNSCHVVMECMDCGSLRDMLNNNLNIDNPTKIRILANVTSGLQFLHQASPPVVHGDINCKNILLDSNIVAKLTGIGFNSKSTVLGSHGHPFWMAPELLDSPDLLNPTDSSVIPRLTTESDVYALGVTMWELFSTKKVPYNILGHNNSKVLDAIRLRDLRPEVPQEAPLPIRDLMVECWHKNPDRRPSISEVFARLQACLKEFQDRAASQARHMSENLNLLHQVLPPKVAEALRRGEKVKPESFDPVTLFFSDIVGYTDLSAELPPEKVMNMLDRMYTQFDAVCSRYQLFKVETIGDAYMCVGGLPEQQSDHTVRVALFAMDVIQAAQRTPVDLENEQLGNLNIRVGFHSGAVIGSVVGELNPRYCLFGDTVNTASRMESNSEKNCINMSPQGHHSLMEQAPNALTQSRGHIQIKGKGKMECFFLVQSDESHRNLRKVFEKVMRGNSIHFRNSIDISDYLQLTSDIEVVCE